ncbi:Uncharacterised protein [Mycobacteroides abscessus subsp. abscessus]|nr:Uncharacterised protein [Mycobacteroides abscessus subsp. abscessus]
MDQFLEVPQGSRESVHAVDHDDVERLCLVGQPACDVRSAPPVERVHRPGYIEVLGMADHLVSTVIAQDLADLHLTLRAGSSLGDT